LRLQGAGSFRECCEFLENDEVLFAKGFGPGRKDFKNSINPPPATNRQGGNGTQPKAPADVHVDERIVFGVRAMLDLTGA